MKGQGPTPAPHHRGKGPQAGPFGPGLVTNVTLMEMPLGLARRRETRQNPSEAPGKPRACLGLITQALSGLGLAWGQPVTVWPGTSWLVQRQISGHGSLSPPERGVLRTERLGQQEEAVALRLWNERFRSCQGASAEVLNCRGVCGCVMSLGLRNCQARAKREVSSTPDPAPSSQHGRLGAL